MFRSFLFKGLIRNVYTPGSLTASFPLKHGKMVGLENDPASYWVFWSLFRGELSNFSGVYSKSRLVTIKVGVRIVVKQLSCTLSYMGVS